MSSPEVHSLKPEHFSPHITHIDLEELYASGVRYLLIDYDNTIAKKAREGRKKIKVVEWEIEGFLRQAVARFEGVCILSNVPTRGPWQNWVRNTAKEHGIHCVCVFGRHRKPAPTGYHQALNLMGRGACPENTLMIGDQYFTDILGALRLGMRAIYVSPLGKDSWFTLKRRAKETVLFEEVWGQQRPRIPTVR